MLRAYSQVSLRCPEAQQAPGGPGPLLVLVNPINQTNMRGLISLLFRLNAKLRLILIFSHVAPCCEDARAEDNIKRFNLTV